MASHEHWPLLTVELFLNDGSAWHAFLRILPTFASFQPMHLEVVYAKSGGTEDARARLMAASVWSIWSKQWQGRGAAAGIDEAIGAAVVPMNVGLRDLSEFFPHNGPELVRRQEVVAQGSECACDLHLKQVTAAPCHRVSKGSTGKEFCAEDGPTDRGQRRQRSYPRARVASPEARV